MDKQSIIFDGLTPFLLSLKLSNFLRYRSIKGDLKEKEDPD